MKKTNENSDQLKSDESRQNEINDAIAMVKEHAQVLENFRTSFKNLENSLTLLKERNHLR